MKIEIKVPAMGESISEATIGQILKPAGSQVSMDEELLELETDKVNQAIYAQAAGVVTYNVATGDVVKIGQVIGSIDAAGKVEKKAEPVAAKPAASAPAPAPKKSSEPVPQGKQARISKEEYVSELSAEKPVAKAEAMPPRPPKASVSKGERQETRQKMSKVRQVIAKRMVEAQHTTAMLTTFNEVDMSAVMSLREKYKDAFIKTYGVKLGFMSFFVKACVDALMHFPDVNSYIDGDEIVHREYYDIGVAVGTDRGVFVPVVKNCDQLSFDEIEKAIETHAKKAREGKIALEDLQGGSFTITNGGVYGSLLSTPILNPPQSGILGMHNIVKRPIVVNDQIVIRPMMYLALSYDHRIVDGKGAVSFLVAVKNYLEDPSRLLLNI